MRQMIFLLTKDCMSVESLPVYGNTYWKTPNIDALAEQGTVFRKHYTAAASTVMSLTAMLTGRYLYEFESRKKYEPVQQEEFPSIFSHFQKCGYETHLIWDDIWTKEAWPLIREFGDEELIRLHSIDIAQRTGVGKVGKLTDEPIFRDDLALKNTIELIKETLNGIDTDKPQFIWMHLPHVLKGRTCYMEDMDAFDEIVGFVRAFAGDNNIYLSTDHGHMNLHKGLVGYGFNVYEPIIHIPLITPRIDGKKEINEITCNIDIPSILKGEMLQKHEYIICDTQYYGQPKRITAIVTDRMKYVYNKNTDTEELYDLEWDPYENHNILSETGYDENRRRKLLISEYYFYPYKENAKQSLLYLRNIKDSIWKDCCEEKSCNEIAEQPATIEEAFHSDYSLVKKEKGIIFALAWKLKKMAKILFNKT